MGAGIADFMAQPWLYLSMPAISAAVGYGTNLVAIWMMFYPIEFVGVLPPVGGWQGVIPRRAPRMASIAVDTLIEKLIDQREIFSRLDPQRIAAELEGPLNDMVEDITDRVMREHQPILWESLPDIVKNRVYKRIGRQTPQVVAEIVIDLQTHIDRMVDLKDMVITNLTRDKALLNTIFQEVGHAEFRFIARSGIYFGGLFGVVQMTVWIFFQYWWLLPAFGLLVGCTTNWLALKMIFNPKEIMRAGPFKIQGLFIKRQNRVAADYGRLISARVITPRNIIEAVLEGPYSDKVFAMIGRHVHRAIDEQVGIAKALVPLTVGTESYIGMKNAAVERVIANMPDALKHVEAYAEDALDLQNTLVARMQALSPEQFEAMLRPAFEQDEWILIAVGAVLGLLVGVFQLVVLFGDKMGITGGGDGRHAAVGALAHLLRVLGLA